MTALGAVVQVAVVLGFGGLLTSLGYIPLKTQMTMHNITQVFLAPVLVYFSVASMSFGLHDILAHWHMALYFAMLMLLVAMAFWFIAYLAKFSRKDCQWVAASILFQDWSLLPLAVVQALANSATSSTHYLFQDPSDTRQAVIARGISYIVLYSFVLSILQFIFSNSPVLSSVEPPFRRPYFARSPSSSQSLSNIIHPADLSDHSRDNNEHSHRSETSVASASRNQELFDLDVEEITREFPPNKPWILYDDGDTESEHNNGIQNQQRQGYAHDEVEPDEEEDNQNPSVNMNTFTRPRPYFWRGRRRRSSAPRTLLQSLQQRLSDLHHLSNRSNRYNRYQGRVLQMGLKVSRIAVMFVGKLSQLWTAPVLAAVLALMASIVPALQQHIMDPEAYLHRFIVHPIEESGVCATPLILLGTGAQFLRLLQGQRNIRTSHGCEGRQSEGSTITTNNISATRDNNGSSSELQLESTSQRHWVNNLGERVSRSVKGLPKSLRWTQVSPMMCVLLLRNAVMPLLCLGSNLLWRRLFTTPLTSDPMWCCATVLAVLTPISPETIETMPRVKRVLLARHRNTPQVRLNPTFWEGEDSNDDDSMANKQQRRYYFWGYVAWLPAVFVWALLLSYVSPAPRARVK